MDAGTVFGLGEEKGLEKKKRGTAMALISYLALYFVNSTSLFTLAFADVS